MKPKRIINLKDEDTIVEQNNELADNPKPDERSGAWKSVFIGGIPGIIFGAAGTAFAQEVVDTDFQGMQSEEDSDSVSSDIEDQEIEVEVADSVNDDMSFSEAFAAAREDVGPGGVFEWHGNIYNTFTAEEWEEMSDEDKQEFADGVHSVQGHDDYQSEEVLAQTESDIDDAPIEVLVHEVGSMTNEDGDIINMAMASVDGHDAAFIDTDNDGCVDGVLIDSNDDGVIDDNEIIDMPNSDINISYLAMMAEGPEDSLYEGTPDYTNDADTSSLA